MSFKDSLNRRLVALFEQYSSDNSALEIICLATTDGFPVYHYARIEENFDAETMAAAASTLCSVSNAVAHQILSKQFKTTFIESEQGNVAFVAMQVCDKDFVLSMSAKSTMNIANLRLLITRLAGEISALDIANVA